MHTSKTIPLTIVLALIMTVSPRADVLNQQNQPATPASPESNDTNSQQLPSVNQPADSPAARPSSPNIVRAGQPRQKIQREKNYVPGRLIIKFKNRGSNRLTGNAQTLVNAKRPLQAATADRSPSLDRLIQRHRVSRARQLFLNPETRPGLRAKLAQRIRRRQERMRRRGLQAESAEQLLDKLENVYVFEVPEDTDIESLAADFRQDPHVEYAHPDYIAQATYYPNDWLYYLMWNLDKIQATGPGLTSLDLNQGEGIVAGVVDTGLDYTHPDIIGNVWENTVEAQGSPGVDDDGNGFIDDIRGWDFTTCASWGLVFCDVPKSRDNDPMDGDGHGTHTSGTIAAVGGNSDGIIGLAPQAKIMPLKALNDEGEGSFSDLADAIIYGASFDEVKVLNNSWGCSDPCPSAPEVEAAVMIAYNAGVIVVFAAGNEIDDVANYSPQNMNETIAVSASTETDQLAGFSNFGNLIDVAAPGVNIPSTHSGHWYSSMMGTSMAAPHVSGLAALIISYHQDIALDYELVRKIIRHTADDIGPPGFDTSFGYGRINALEALTLGRLKPVMDPVSAQSVSPFQTLNIPINADDPDHDPADLALSASMTNGNPVSVIGAAFTDNGDGTGAFAWMPDGTHAGQDYYLIFRVTDPDGFYTTQTVQITVQGTLIDSHIYTNTTWDLPNSPYIITIAVGVDNGATLTIQPGVEVFFNDNTGITVGGVAGGNLIAQGTPGQPITFKSGVAPEVGRWEQIYLQGGGSSIEYVDVRHSKFGIFQDGVSYGISHSHFESNVWAMVFANGVSPDVSDNVIQSNIHGCLILSGGEQYVSQPVLRNNLFSAELGFKVYSLATTPDDLSEYVIDAEGNDWELTDPAAIAAKIFDGNDSGNEFAPVVDFEPFLP